MEKAKEINSGAQETNTKGISESDPKAMTLRDYKEEHDGKLPETLDDWKRVDPLGIRPENPYKDHEYGAQEMARILPDLEKLDSKT